MVRTYSAAHAGWKSLRTCVLITHQLPAFASVSLGSLTLFLSGPHASGSRPLPDGERQYPGSSNHMVLEPAES